MGNKIFLFYSILYSELGSKDLNDYKNSKAYSYYKSGWLQPLLFHNLSGSKFCIFKGECRRSQSLNEPFHKLWLIIEKTSKIRSAHCTCMAGMGETCNHVAAAMFRIEAAVRTGLTNPSCTSSANEWLPCRKNVEQPLKLKDINFSREVFAERGKKKRALVASPKKKFDPLANCDKKPLSLFDVAAALEDIAPDSILFTAVPKPEIDFVREIIKEPVEAVKEDHLINIDEIIKNSESATECCEKINNLFTPEVIAKIDTCTRGQSTNEQWYLYRKGVITGSKAHEVLTKMKKIETGKGGTVDIWSCKQKISGLTFINPNIPALKYGRDMEIEAVNAFLDVMRKNHTNVSVSECGLILDRTMPYIGASPDRLFSCSCCGVACVEIKCPYSVNYTTPDDTNLDYLLKVDDEIKLKRTHKYFTQCMMQMGVTNISKLYFVVWTPHGLIIDHISFDPELWSSMKHKFEKFYKEFYLKSFYSS